MANKAIRFDKTQAKSSSISGLSHHVVINFGHYCSGLKKNWTWGFNNPWDGDITPKTMTENIDKHN